MTPPKHPPNARSYKRRLPAAALKLRPKECLHVADVAVAQCVRSFGKRQGWKMQQQTVDGVLWMWRMK